MFLLSNVVCKCNNTIYHRGEDMFIKTANRVTVIEYLKKDLLINLNMLGILENVPDVEIFVDNEIQPSGVLLRKNYFHYIYTKSQDFISDMCNNFFSEGFYGFSGVEEGIAKKIRSNYRVNWESLCRLYYMPQGNLNLEPIKSTVESVRLEDAEIVNKYYAYRNNHSLAAIKDDIKNRPSSAIYIDDDIASWVLVHDDNSMGIMYTKEEFRRTGYGIDVTLDLANKIIESGKIPFLQIVRGNNMSPGLAEKCGFVEVGGVQWFGIVVGTPKEIIDFNDLVRLKLIEEIPFIAPWIPDKYNGMFMYLCNYKESKNLQPDMEITEIREQNELMDWITLLQQSYKESVINVSEINYENILNMINNNRLVLYMGFKNRKAVSTVAFYQQSEEEWGVFLLTTVEKYRNCGIGTHTIQEGMRRIKEKSGYIICLQTPEEYSRFFIKVGFEESHIMK